MLVESYFKKQWSQFCSFVSLNYCLMGGILL